VHSRWHRPGKRHHGGIDHHLNCLIGAVRGDGSRLQRYLSRSRSQLGEEPTIFTPCLHRVCPVYAQVCDREHGQCIVWDRRRLQGVCFNAMVQICMKGALKVVWRSF
jgi:hypothetical protein